MREDEGFRGEATGARLALTHNVYKSSYCQLRCVDPAMRSRCSRQIAVLLLPSSMTLYAASKEQASHGTAAFWPIAKQK